MGDLRVYPAIGTAGIDTINAIEQFNKDQDVLIKKIEGWNEALQGNDGAGGKRKELAGLESAL